MIRTGSIVLLLTMGVAVPALAQQSSGPPLPPAACIPNCRAGFACADGRCVPTCAAGCGPGLFCSADNQCVSACNPPCGAGETCTSQGQCLPAPPPAPAGWAAPAGSPSPYYPAAPSPYPGAPPAYAPPPAYAAPPASAPPPSPAASPPDPSTHFGARGQIAITDGLQLQGVYSSESMGGPTQTNVYVQPSLDVFIVPNLSIGGSLGLSSQSTTYTGPTVVSPTGGAITPPSTTITTTSLSVRVGYALHLASVVSLWAQGGLVLFHASFSGVDSPADTFFSFTTSASVLWHPAPHFFIGAGPTYTTDLEGEAQGMDLPKQTRFGLQSIIGGYFGGR